VALRKQALGKNICTVLSFESYGEFYKAYTGINAKTPTIVEKMKKLCKVSFLP
jgi:hypothetical protein